MTFRRVWSAPLISLFGSLMFVVGCYRPNIAQGGFQCASGNVCPDGFHCVSSNNRCYEGDAGPESPVCVSSPTPTCSTEAATGQACNPTCQTGCACGFCSVANGATTCLTVTAGNSDIGEVCDPQTEAPCKAGLFCRPECGQTTFGRCYKFCAAKDDCNGLDCGASGTSSGSAGTFSFSLCNLPDQTCDPVAKSGCPTDPNEVLGCYVDSFGGTFCDCNGTKAIGDSCAFAGDCSPGLICENFGPTNTCEAVCVSASDCTSSGGCMPTNGSFGYCL
jgi:hypothetical protein